MALQIQIDGEEVALNNVWIHSQKDPYPGGHEYCLFLPSQFAQEWLSELGLEAESPHQFDERLSRDGLDWLSSVLARTWPKPITPPVYVVNSITNVAALGDGLYIRGVCSPHVNSSKSRQMDLASQAVETKRLS